MPVGIRKSVSVGLVSLCTLTGVFFALSAIASAGPLPNNRAYELVSPAGSREVYVPDPDVALEEDLKAERPFRASADGSAVTYVAEPPSSGEGGNGSQGPGLGNEYVAARGAKAGPDGWEVSDITPPGTNTATLYEAFSSDLSVGIVWSPNNKNFPPLTEDAPAPCRVLYSRTGAGSGLSDYHPLFTKTSPQTPGSCGGENEPIAAGGNQGTATVPGYSQLLFQTSAALTPEAEEAAGEGSYDLYDSVGGRLSSVNVLNGKPDPTATFGGPAERGSGNGFNRSDFSNVISADGSRVFWTDVSSGIVYVRENPTEEPSTLVGEHCVEPAKACTAAVSAGPARYWTATPDGRYAYYTEGEKLYRFSVGTEAREELAGVGAGVQGVIGTSEDGAYVYFVAAGALAPGATPQTCKEAERNTPEEVKEFVEEEEGALPAGRGCNLYVLHAGEPLRFVATLAPKDNNLPGPGNIGQAGDWQPNPGTRTAEVTPDGQSLVFESRRPLTGYDNGLNVTSESGVAREVEVFLYDAQPGGLSCVSCSPDGAPVSVGAHSNPGIGTYVPVSVYPTFVKRWVNDTGTEVFFDTDQALVSQDTNGRQDVYEWEREDNGGCPAGAAGGGCVYLLSGGTSVDQSYLVDASANGEDVFFTTRDHLVPQDQDDKMYLYDARVDGGFPETSLACAGTGCQGVPPAPPVFATPSSVTFNGVGNFPPPPPPTKVTKKTVKCPKGKTRNKHNQCVKSKSKKKSKARKASRDRRARR
jgi:hypothetical protein